MLGKPRRHARKRRRHLPVHGQLAPEEVDLDQARLGIGLARRSSSRRVRPGSSSAVTTGLIGPVTIALREHVLHVGMLEPLLG